MVPSGVKSACRERLFGPAPYVPEVLILDDSNHGILPLECLLLFRDRDIFLVMGFCASQIPLAYICCSSYVSAQPALCLQRLVEEVW